MIWKCRREHHIIAHGGTAVLSELTTIVFVPKCERILMLPSHNIILLVILPV